MQPDPVRAARIRRATAHRMQQSKRDVPHLYLDVDVDMSAVQALREHLQTGLSWQTPPSGTAIIVHVVTRLLVERPQLNVTYGDKGPTSRDRVSIGVAIDTLAGLVVPVLPEADDRSLHEIAVWLRDAAVRAREFSLKWDDLGPKSLVVYDLGPLGIDRCHAIIDPPDPMILAVGRIADRVLVEKGQPAVSPTATLSLSLDHRVLDASAGAHFLAELRGRLESIVASE